MFYCEVLCNLCGTLLVGKPREPSMPLIYCACKAISIDPAESYYRINGNPDNFTCLDLIQTINSDINHIFTKEELDIIEEALFLQIHRTHLKEDLKKIKKVYDQVLLSKRLWKIRKIIDTEGIIYREYWIGLIVRIIQLEDLKKFRMRAILDSDLDFVDDSSRIGTSIVNKIDMPNEKQLEISTTNSIYYLDEIELEELFSAVHAKEREK